MKLSSQSWFEQLAVDKDRLVPIQELNVVVAPIPPPFRGYFTEEGRSIEANWPGQRISVRADDLSKRSLAIDDKEARRLGRRSGRSAKSLQVTDEPVWLGACGQSWREIAVIPSLGGYGRFQVDASGRNDPWVPNVILDEAAPATHSRLFPAVQICQWSGLLSLLASRDFDRCAGMADQLMADGGIRRAVLQKIDNPFATIMIALVGIATGRLRDWASPDEWLLSLSTWLPQIPDGPVLAAHHLLGTGQHANRVAAKPLLHEACRRGVPIFSLAVDWLAQDLTAISEDPETLGAAKEMWRVAQLCDPTSAFTVLRIPQ